MLDIFCVFCYTEYARKGNLHTKENIMKKLLSLTLLSAVLLVCVLSLTSCSAYGGIEKNFLNEGYTVFDTNDEDGNNYLSFVGDLNGEGEVSCTVHILKKTSLTSFSAAVILEFGADADAAARLSELLTEDDISYLRDVDDTSRLLHGNCILIPVAFTESSIEAMIQIFEK